MKFWNKEAETLNREQLQQLQSQKLVAQVRRMYERVECFRSRMDERGLKPEDIKGVEDLPRLPFSYKKDLRDYYPYGLFAEPMENIVRLHASSGTTGKRIVVVEDTAQIEVLDIPQTAGFCTVAEDGTVSYYKKEAALES